MGIVALTAASSVGLQFYTAGCDSLSRSELGKLGPPRLTSSGVLLLAVLTLLLRGSGFVVLTGADWPGLADLRLPWQRTCADTWRSSRRTGHQSVLVSRPREAPPKVCPGFSIFEGRKIDISESLSDLCIQYLPVQLYSKMINGVLFYKISVCCKYEYMTLRGIYRLLGFQI
jgi:hypothetical protein